MSDAPVFMTQATIAEVPQLDRILRLTPGAPQWTPEQVAALFNAEGCRPRLVLLATQDNIASGFAVMSCLPGTEPLEAELESIAVVPEQHGQGIGRALLEAATDWALQQKAAILRLEVRQSNVRALRLYAQSGWVKVGVRRAYYTDPVEDAAVMQRGTWEV